MNRLPAPAQAAESSFEAFVARSSTRLLRAAYLLCGDRHTAEDLLQLTMLRTARRWSAARTAPEAYARTVLVNLARDGGRLRRRRVTEVLGGRDDELRRFVAGHAERVGERDAVLGALAALPQRQREVIVLRFYADLSVGDTAAAIGASPGTVMSYTSRALSRLRELLADPPATSARDTSQGVEHDHR